ncbi:MAG: AAA family ATPase [Bacteroidetes bacterium]|nr:AAA family ATPase [Bacteroidota bacterium]
MLKSIRLQNFFSFQDCTINLEKGANVLVGINGSGKSNFFKAIRLLEASARPNFFYQLFLNEWGGFESVTNYSNKDLDPIALEFVLDGTAVAKYGFKFREDVYYKIVINKVAGGNNYTLSEKVYLTGKKGKNDFIYLDIHGGKGHLLERNDETKKDRLVFYKEIPDREPYIGKVYDSDRYYALSTIRSALGSIFTYEQFDTYKRHSSIRQSVLATSEIRLTSDGRNLTSLLQTFKSTNKEVLKLVVEALTSVNDNYINIDYGLIGGGNIELQLEERGFRKNIPAVNISDGTLKFLCLMAILYNPNRGSVVCIDEPELGLHPDMINTLHEAIEYAAQTSQIIISTHSSHLLNYFDVEQVRVFEKDENNATVVNQFTKELYANWSQKFQLGKAWREGVIGGKRW